MAGYAAKRGSAPGGGGEPKRQNTGGGGPSGGGGRASQDGELEMDVERELYEEEHEQEMLEDFFEDAVCEGSFLGPALEHLLGALEGADDRAPGPDFAPLAAPREALKRLVAERFGFRAADFSCPDEEDAPTVVAEPAEPGAGAAEPAPKDAAPVGPDVGRMGWMLSPPE